jgi:branched-chain amino acid aminotransferase
MEYHVDGELVPAEDATVPVGDRGLLFGDAAVVDLRAFGGDLFAPEPHLESLERTCDRAGIDPPADLRDRCRGVLSANDLADARLRVTVTRGVEPDGIGSLTPPDAPVRREATATEPTVVVAAGPAPRGGTGGEPPWEGPADLQTVKVRRPDDGAIPATGATGSALPGVLARRELHEGADEAIVRGPNGGVVGGAGSNLFFVAEDGLHTPGEGPVYPGAVRSMVLEFASEADVPVQENAPELSAVRDANEAFLTSTAWGVRPVDTVDGIAVGDGPVTELLRRQYERRVERRYY